MTILGGQGVAEVYEQYTRNHIVTEAVWLLEGDLAEEESTLVKYASEGPLRIALPSRLTPWKGVDDAIEAMALLSDRLGAYQLDIIGEGEEKPSLMKRVEKHGLGDRVRFLGLVPYGEPFFRLLRGYHVVVVPTRGLEDARIVYDAAASGCVLVHANTKTILHSTRELGAKWGFEPGNSGSLASALTEAFTYRDTWGKAAVEGIHLMRGKTIEKMHRERHCAGPAASDRACSRCSGKG